MLSNKQMVNLQRKPKNNQIIIKLFTKNAFFDILKIFSLDIGQFGLNLLTICHMIA